MLLEKPNRIYYIFVLLTSIVLLSFSCQKMPSGKYVKLRKNTTIKHLASKYKSPSWEIKKFNRGKKFSKGEWIFIPKKWGIANYSVSPNEIHKFFEKGDLLWPVPSSRKISSKFGYRWGRLHEGIDIPARVGSHILSVRSGKVVSTSWINGYGRVIVIAHRDTLFSVYAHCSKIIVSKNDIVSKGQVIGLIGQTGRATGPHLHFEIRQDSKALNPLAFFK